LALALALWLKSLALALALGSKSLALALALKVVLGLGLGLGQGQGPLSRLRRPDAIMLYTCVHYVHNSTTSMTVTLLIYFMYPDGICAPWILVWENSGCSCQLLKEFFLTVGWSSTHIVRKCQTSCWSHWCLPSVLSSADCCELVMVNVRGVTNFVILVIFLGVYCLAFFIVNCH